MQNLANLYVPQFSFQTMHKRSTWFTGSRSISRLVSLPSHYHQKAHSLAKDPLGRHAYAHQQ